jgi:hypothetical protein
MSYFVFPTNTSKLQVFVVVSSSDHEKNNVS